MRKAPSANLALIGPKRPPAAALRQILPAAIESFSLDGYLAAAAAPDRIVLFPRGENLDADLAFLREAKARLLWPAPPREIADAIAGLVTDAPPGRGRMSRRRPGPLVTALLLEGAVTRARAHAALASPVRLWVVESVRLVRLSGAELAGLAREGVRWSALRPVDVEGVLCSPGLARALRRPGRLLPRGARIWRAGRARPSSTRSRRPSPR
jgi:hypothetical protein